MREAAEKRLGKIVRRAGFAAVIPGSNDAGALRQGPAVIDKTLQNNFKNDGLCLLGGVGQFIEEQDMLFSVAAEPLEPDQPGGFDVDDLVFRLVIYGTPVDRFRRFIDQFNIQDLRINLTDAVAFAVSGKAVNETGIFAST